MLTNRWSSSSLSIALKPARWHRSPWLNQVRRRSIAPQFLLDDYVPRYQLLSPAQEAKKRTEAYAHLRDCNLCPRLCGVNRFETTGTCLIGSDVVVNTIAPHFGEEPCIQGRHGSGSVFFSGCNLRCVFCQNHDIAHQKNGFNLQPDELAEWFIKLQDVGNVHNINLVCVARKSGHREASCTALPALATSGFTSPRIFCNTADTDGLQVTPEHVVPQAVLAILHAKDMGLRIPIVYNTSSFDSLESIELLDGLVDIYLPDFKVWNNSTSKHLLKADNYAKVAMESIRAMHRQVGDLCMTSDGIAKKGVLVRHLVMPGYEGEGKYIMRWLAELSPDLYVHVMEQYHPRAHVGKGNRRSGRAKDIVEPGGEESDEKTRWDVRYAEINRAVSMEEVYSVRSAAEKAGLWRFVEASEHASFST